MVARQGTSGIRVVVLVPIPGLIGTADVREALGVGAVITARRCTAVALRAHDVRVASRTKTARYDAHDHQEFSMSPPRHPALGRPIHDCS